jgi:dCTP deaminase
MLKPDSWIRKMCKEHKMIDPFVDRQDGHGKISYGLSSYGYDIRIADEYKIFTNVYGAIIDPKAFDSKAFVDHRGPTCVVPPNSFALARTVERFKMPRNALAICLGKSTYARCGIIVNVTPLEPTWEGYLTLEISNTTPLPAKVYSGEGIAQLLFFQGTEVCETAYADRKGKYMNQVGVVPPRILQKR